MSDVGVDVLAEWRVVPENVVSLTVFAFGSRDGFVVEGVLISACVKCFLEGRTGGSVAQFTNRKNNESRITDIKISFS